MNLKKLGWNVAKIGVGVGASVFGGPGTGMLAAAGMEGIHTATSSDRRKEWKKDSERQRQSNKASTVNRRIHYYRRTSAG